MTPPIPEECWFVWDTECGEPVYRNNDLYVNTSSRATAESAACMPNWKPAVYGVHPRYRKQVAKYRNRLLLLAPMVPDSVREDIRNFIARMDAENAKPTESPK